MSFEGPEPILRSARFPCMRSGRAHSRRLGAPAACPPALRPCTIVPERQSVQPEPGLLCFLCVSRGHPAHLFSLTLTFSVNTGNLPPLLLLASFPLPPSLPPSVCLSLSLSLPLCLSLSLLRPCLSFQPLSPPSTPFLQAAEQEELRWRGPLERKPGRRGRDCGVDPQREPGARS